MAVARFFIVPILQENRMGFHFFLKKIPLIDYTLLSFCLTICSWWAWEVGVTWGKRWCSWPAWIPQVLLLISTKQYLELFVATLREGDCRSSPSTGTKTTITKHSLEATALKTMQWISMTTILVSNLNPRTPADVFCVANHWEGPPLAISNMQKLERKEMVENFVLTQMRSPSWESSGHGILSPTIIFWCFFLKHLSAIT